MGRERRTRAGVPTLNPARSPKSALIVAVASYLLFLLARDGVSFRVVGSSMEPTFRSGEYVFGLPGRPGRGDVWVLKTNDGLIVKRLIGLAGDTVAMESGHLSVNRGALEIEYRGFSDHDVRPPSAWHYRHLLDATPERAPSGLTWGPIVVPAGGLFVLGDNLGQSGDSRAAGFLPESALVARLIGVSGTDVITRVVARSSSGRRLP